MPPTLAGSRRVFSTVRVYLENQRLFNHGLFSNGCRLLWRTVTCGFRLLGSLGRLLKPAWPWLVITCRSAFLSYSSHIPIVEDGDSHHSQVLGEWADHYTCSVEYDNQTIAFQTWHSLGFKTTAGLPMALSAGDSKPTWQAPRLTTAWYSNVSTDPSAVPASLFHLPKLCIPIPGAEKADAALRIFHTSTDRYLVTKLEALRTAGSGQLIV